MGQRLLVSARLMTMVIALVSLAVVPAGSQAQAPGAAKPGVTAPKNGDWVPPRLPDGQPDMQGIYVPNWPSTVPIERWTEAERKEWANTLVKMRGGFVAVADGHTLAEVPLPVAGLMSDRPAAEVNRALDALNATT